MIKNEVDRETDISRLIIHPVLQEVLQDSMDPQTQRGWAQQAVSIIALALPFVDRRAIQAHGHRCLTLITQWNIRSPESDLIRQQFGAL